jgi:hypothetical protein
MMVNIPRCHRIVRGDEDSRYFTLTLTKNFTKSFFTRPLLGPARPTHTLLGLLTVTICLDLAKFFTPHDV